uniref:Transposase Tc1-like domain-containing protein n=1 Tax=Poecilia latipinna TaxID=48699 RepID=A0A3B3VIG8_9TELE
MSWIWTFLVRPWGIISRRFQVLRSSVQSLICEDRRGGNVQPSHRSSLGQKVKIDPKIKAKSLVKMLAEAGKTVSLSAVKCVLYRHGLKGNSARKKTLLQKKHKKPDCSLQMDTRTF